MATKAKKTKKTVYDIDFEAAKKSIPRNAIFVRVPACPGCKTQLTNEQAVAITRNDVECVRCGQMVTLG